MNGPLIDQYTSRFSYVLKICIIGSNMTINQQFGRLTADNKFERYSLQEMQGTGLDIMSKDIKTNSKLIRLILTVVNTNHAYKRDPSWHLRAIKRIERTTNEDLMPIANLLHRGWQQFPQLQDMILDQVMDGLIKNQEGQLRALKNYTIPEEILNTYTVQYEGAVAAIITFEKTDRKSFEKVSGFQEEFKKHSPDPVPIAIVGITTDSEEPEEITTEEGEQLSNLLNCQYFETELDNKEQIERIFHVLAQQVKVS